MTPLAWLDNGDGEVTARVGNHLVLYVRPQTGAWWGDQQGTQWVVERWHRGTIATLASGWHEQRDAALRAAEAVALALPEGAR